MKLVDKSNALDLHTHFLLISATDVEPALLGIIYDDVAYSSANTEKLKSFFIEEKSRSRDIEKVNQAIHQVIAEANCFKDMREKLEYNN